jgi:hypothetical protein
VSEPAADLDRPAVGQLVRRAGRADPVELVPLPGGKNNRVFQVRLADGSSLVLKSYFAHPHDTRDRLGAEWAFLTYAWGRGVRAVPEPLASDRDRRLGLYAHLPGRKIEPGAVRPGHVEAALDFVLAINAPPRADAAALPAASEACFSVAAHLATVDRRVRLLASLDPEAPMRAEAERFVAARLAPAWDRVRTRVAAFAARDAGSLEKPIEPEATIVSPSDFGFHNALLDGSRLGFLDFEYAGRDDPAKLVCDFFCQPEIPVPVTLFPRAVERIVTGLGLPDSHRERCAALLDVYRIKWVCIILNQFLPVGAARRSFAASEARAARCAEQLAKAAAKLDDVES